MERKAGEMAEIYGSCSASHQMYIYDHICFGMDENYAHHMHIYKKKIAVLRKIHRSCIKYQPDIPCCNLVLTQKKHAKKTSPGTKPPLCESTGRSHGTLPVEGAKGLMAEIRDQHQLRLVGR